MKKSLCDTVVGYVNKLAEEDVKRITKAEIEESWSGGSVTETVRFEAADGRTFWISVTTPKKKVI